MSFSSCQHSLNTPKAVALAYVQQWMVSHPLSPLVLLMSVRETQAVQSNLSSLTYTPFPLLSRRSTHGIYDRESPAAEVLSLYYEDSHVSPGI
mgnify:CR=1 FL=1